MTSCPNCGHQVGAGRFCPQCGHPIRTRAADAGQDWRTDTAERPAASPPPPSIPPPAPAGAAPPPRYPLYADQVGDEPAPTYAAPPPADTATAPIPPMPPPHRRRPWATWVAATVVLVLVSALGVWLLTRNDWDGSATDRPRRGEGSSVGSPAEPGGVVPKASIEVPATAPSGLDVDGNRVDYGGDNMLDGVPETTWRMPGEGTGAEITITLPEETRLGSVGLVNGYAKSAEDAQGRELDWYHGNRRVESVEWVFDDGTTVPQDLTDTTAVQSVDVDVTTTTITLRLVSVSGVGQGPAARNYTAISDVTLVGAA